MKILRMPTFLIYILAFNSIFRIASIEKDSLVNNFKNDILSELLQQNFWGKKSVSGWLVVGFMADCLTRDLGQWVGNPPWGSF